NGPLPTWIGWYLQHLPHWFHAATAFGTLALELFLVWMLFLPRRVRIVCFFIVTVWQIGVILSANYTFLNYLVLALAIFLLADRYGLFAVMTRGRYEIEFQGSNDGQNWTAYKFRFKPQNPYEAPRIYAPYQPRFDWNLWFASLGHWRSNSIVPRTEERLLEGSSDVLALFANNPFPQPPRQIRVLLWQYWFTSMQEKREEGLWWRRQLL